jgi:hypothetical protein
MENWILLLKPKIARKVLSTVTFHGCIDVCNKPIENWVRFNHDKNRFKSKIASIHSRPLELKHWIDGRNWIEYFVIFLPRRNKYSQFSTLYIWIVVFCLFQPSFVFVISHMNNNPIQNSIIYQNVVFNDIQRYTISRSIDTMK